MVELLEVAADEKVGTQYWRVVVRGSWIGTVSRMRDQHLGVRIYEDTIVSPEMLRDIADAVDRFEKGQQANDSLPLFPPQPGEIGN